VNPSFFLGIRILNNVKFGCGAKLRNFGKRDEIVDLLAIEFEMKASVLERRRRIND
jgi:hypothetical protein